MVISIKEWNGINNSVDPAVMGLAGCVSAKNVDFDPAGRQVSRRRGYSRVVTETNPHSGWSDGKTALFAVGSSIKQVKKVGSSFLSTTVYTSPSPLGRVAYLSLNGRIYFSDGVAKGVIYNGSSRSWGLDIPAQAPNITASTGGQFKKGSYLVGVTFIRSDGQESGMSPTTRIDIPADGGRIVLSNIPVSPDTDVSYKGVYLSLIDGESLYYAANIANNVTDFILASGVDSLGAHESTTGLYPPPAGHILGFFRGRVLVAENDFLHFSEPGAYELFRAGGYFQFDSRITMSAAVLGGIFVSTQNKTVFLRGDSPETFIFEDRGAPPAIEGSAVLDEISDTALESGYPSAIWLTPAGMYQGFADGSIKAHTAYKPATASRSSAFLRRGSGQTHYIVFIHGSGASENAVAGSNPIVTNNYGR